MKNQVLFKDVYEVGTTPFEVSVGLDSDGNKFKIDLESAPHILIGGTTGSGKSILLHNIMLNLLKNNSDAKFLIIDPKKIEFGAYNDSNSLLCPVICDENEAIIALEMLYAMMDDRYAKFAAINGVCRNLDTYNKLVANEDKLFPIVVIIDEISDLMSFDDERCENVIRRLTQLGRSAGIHLIVATQNVSTSVLNSKVKVNFPTRIAFRTSSGRDRYATLSVKSSKVLTKTGEALIKLVNEETAVNVQIGYVSNEDISEVIALQGKKDPHYDPKFLTLKEVKREEETINEENELKYQEAVQLVKTLDTISISTIQIKLAIGFPRASYIMNRLISEGYVDSSVKYGSHKVIKK